MFEYDFVSDYNENFCGSNKGWTKQRVVRAYKEWRDLQEHAMNCIYDWDRVWKSDSNDLYRLNLPGWIGTNYPGKEFEVEYWTPAGYDIGEERHPLEWLYTTKWLEEEQREAEKTYAAAEARRKEAEEYREYKRLKKKFEKESPDD